MSLHQPHTSNGPIQPIRLRQIALVAKDLKESERLLTKVLGTSIVYQDPHVEKWGLKNILLCFGGNCLEVVSPFQGGTTAGRLLEKRGDGGYMIIMQTIDATLRRDYISQNNLCKIITDVESKETVMVQYHPKGIKGGVMPELDSHKPTREWPAPLFPDITPWLALGPTERLSLNLAAMRHASWLRLVGVELRLAAGDLDTNAAAQQWERLFGCLRQKDTIHYLNARLTFVPGRRELPEGIQSITLAVEGSQKLARIKWAAENEHVIGHEGRSEWFVDMLGVRWYFIEGTDMSRNIQSAL